MSTGTESRAVCLTYWLQGHNNPSYDALFSRLGSVVRFQKVVFSRYRPITSLQYRVWSKSSQRVIYPLAFRYLGRKHTTLFCVDPRQIPFWQGKVILDMNDPKYDAPALTLFKQPQVRAIVVSTDRTRNALLELGLKTPVHVIPQIVPVTLDPAEIQDVRRRYRSEGDVIAGYMAPTLSLVADGTGRYRRGLDDLDLLFGAAEEARKVEPRLRLWLLGEPSASVRRFVRSRPWITLFGYVPLVRLFSYIANFDIGVYPRTLTLPYGSFSVKIVQYMACGLPIISNAVQEAFQVEEAECGVVCRSQDEFTRALIELTRSKELRTRLGTRGKSHAKVNTDWTYQSVYEGLIRDVVRQPN